MNKENEINSGSQRRRRLRQEIMRDALQERYQNTPDNSKIATALNIEKDKDRFRHFRELNPIKRSVSFSNQSEARSFNSKDPAVELGDVTYLSTKTKTPPSRRIHPPAARSHGLYVPSLDETILEDDIAFSFLESRESGVIDNGLQEQKADQEVSSEESADMLEQEDESDSVASDDNWNSSVTSNNSNILEVNGEEEDDDSQHHGRSDSFLTDVRDSTRIPLHVILQQATHEWTNYSIRGTPSESIPALNQMDGGLNDTEVEDDDNEFDLVGRKCATKVLALHRAGYVSSTELEEEEEELQEMNNPIAACSTTEEETVKECDDVSLQRHLTKSTLVLSDDATEPENDAPPTTTLMSVIPPEMLGELNVAYNLLHLAVSENAVALVSDHVKATVSIMALDFDRYVSRKAGLMKESGVEAISTKLVEKEYDGFMQQPITKLDNDAQASSENAIPSTDPGSTKGEDTSQTLFDQEDSVTKQQETFVPVQYDGEFIFQDDIPFAPNAEEVKEEYAKGAEDIRAGVQSQFVIKEEEDTPGMQPRRFPLVILRAETYEAPPSVMQQPSIDIAKLIHICTFSPTRKMNRARISSQKANRSSRKTRQYPVHSLAETNPIEQSPIDTLIAGRMHKKSRY